MPQQFIISPKTQAVISHFDDYGNEISMIYEGSDTFIVRQSPKKIVETTFNFLGFSLDGAVRVAQHILQRKMRVPVVLSAPDGIALLNCRTVSGLGSVWIVTAHIDQIRPLAKNRTLVEFKGGQTVVVGMSQKALQDRRNEAAFLILTIAEKLKRGLPSSNDYDDVVAVAEIPTKYGNRSID